MNQKKSITVRLSETTMKELAEIAKRQGVSQAEVISVLVHQYYTGADYDDISTWFDLVRIS